MSSNFDSLADVAAHYGELVAEHGDSHRAVGWESAHIQAASFIQMTRLDGLVAGARVLDVGCGLGHFKDFVDKRGLDVDYTGWDICAPLVHRAQARHPGVRYEVRDILVDPPDEQFDVVVCSGAMNLRLPDHEVWLASMLRAMFGACRTGMAFNLLSYYYARQHPYLQEPQFYYAQPERILGFCLELSPHVVLDHAELAQSFALHVYRRNQAPMHRLAQELGLGRALTPAHDAVLEHYATAGMYEEMITYLESLEPAAEVHDRIGLAAFHLGDHARQIQAFARAVELAHDSTGYLVHLAIAYLDAGHRDEAIRAFERARALAPDDEGIAERLRQARNEASR